MNTSILTIALTAALLAGNNAVPTWQTNYSQAQKLGAAQKRPLAVVFGTNGNGWTKAPEPEVAKLLAENYVCVFVDTTTQAGQRLAADFAINGGTGLVISDRMCQSQAFWHQGDMANDLLVRYLTRYADPNVDVRGTETANTARTSYYPSNAYQAPTRSANC